MTKCDSKDENPPNRKARKANSKYKDNKRRQALDLEIVLTDNGEKCQGALKEKEEKKKHVIKSCLPTVSEANKAINHALPTEQEWIQIKIGEDNVYDVLILDFDDGNLLDDIQQYKKFEMSKGCVPIYWKKHKNRNSECDALKGMFMFHSLILILISTHFNLFFYCFFNR